MSTSRTDSQILKRKNFFLGSAGFGIVEAILSVCLVGLLVTIVAGAIIYSQQSSASQSNRSQALFLAAEGLEAARNMRDVDFANLIGGTHGLAISQNTWTFSGDKDTTGIFSRQIKIDTVDQNTKKIMATLNWNNGKTSSSVSLVTYLTNWR
jgi:Tfp pilus assembly protein PilV